MRLRLLLWTAALGFALSGCQTSMVRQFEKVHPGMDKHQVLEAMGSPRASTRLHGKDRWIYVFYEDDIRFEKEIHFSSGVATYVGGPWTPPPEASAEARDKKVEESNAQLIAEEDARKEARRNNADLYLQYEKSVRNHDEVKYMPDFQEIK